MPEGEGGYNPEALEQQVLSTLSVAVRDKDYVTIGEQITAIVTDETLRNSLEVWPILLALSPQEKRAALDAWKEVREGEDVDAMFDTVLDNDALVAMLYDAEKKAANRKKVLGRFTAPYDAKLAAQTKELEAKNTALEQALAEVERLKKDLKSKEVVSQPLVRAETTGDASSPEALMQSLETLSPEAPELLQRFANGLVETARHVLSNDQAWLSGDGLNHLDEYVYHDIPAFGTLALAGGAGGEIRSQLHHLVDLQSWLHNELPKVGIEPISPHLGEAFDRTRHEFNDKTLVWITEGEERNGKIAGTVRIGYQNSDSEQVIRPASVRRYAVTDDTPTGAPTAGSAYDLLKNAATGSFTPAEPKATEGQSANQYESISTEDLLARLDTEKASYPLALQAVVDEMKQFPQSLRVIEGNTDLTSDNAPVREAFTDILHAVFTPLPSGPLLQAQGLKTSEPLAMCAQLQQRYNHELAEHKIAPIAPQVGEKFDADKHFVPDENIDIIWNTTKPEKHNTIYELKTCGFEKDGKVAIKARVSKVLYTDHLPHDSTSPIGVASAPTAHDQQETDEMTLDEIAQQGHDEVERRVAAKKAAEAQEKEGSGRPAELTRDDREADVKDNERHLRLQEAIEARLKDMKVDIAKYSKTLTELNEKLELSEVPLDRRKQFFTARSQLPSRPQAQLLEMIDGHVFRPFPGEVDKSDSKIQEDLKQYNERQAKVRELLNNKFGLSTVPVSVGDKFEASDRTLHLAGVVSTSDSSKHHTIAEIKRDGYVVEGEDGKTILLRPADILIYKASRQEGSGGEVQKDTNGDIPQQPLPSANGGVEPPVQHNSAVTDAVRASEARESEGNQPLKIEACSLEQVSRGARAVNIDELKITGFVEGAEYTAYLQDSEGMKAQFKTCKVKKRQPNATTLQFGNGEIPPNFAQEDNNATLVVSDGKTSDRVNEIYVR